ncbi:MAG: cyclic nucleotide-binding domain-containing protein [Mariprofundus sp.]|nr:cyclic nucleotide-binding domain-containing protein [Mariprofundus sp.]
MSKASSSHTDSSTAPPTRNQTLLKVYADLVDLYPDNARYIKQYADLLISMSKISTATELLRQWHSQLLKNNEPNKADVLIKQYPIIGRMRESDHGVENIQALLPASMRNRFWLKLHQKRLREGQYLFHRGETLDSLYLVCAGELAEFSSAADGTPVLLNLIQAGDILAEDKLLHAGALQSDIIANKASIVVKLPRKKLMQAVLHSPLLKKIISRKVDYRQLIRLISASPVLQILPLDMRQQLASESYIERYSAATTIHKAGEKLHHVDLIVEGEASFHWQTPNAAKHLSTLKPGALIGETAVMHDSGCPADLLTQHGVSMLHISYAAFINTLEAYPPLRKKLTAYAATQRSQLMRKLNELQTQQLP